MSSFEANPFATLTLIAAPAVLTNACSLLALNTANRFGRAIDRSRWLTTEMDHLEVGTEEYVLREQQLLRVSRRAEWLLHAQTAFYLAVGLFAGSALVSVMGAIAAAELNVGMRWIGIGSLLIGAAAVLSLLGGCAMLVRETRLAVLNLADDAALLVMRRRAKAVTRSGPQTRSPEGT